MPISITNAVTQTYLFEFLLLGAILFSLRKKTSSGIDKSVTEQIKGIAILAVVFSHIGYFLVNDNRFFFPLSVYAGMGVDAFLVFSGFGLTISMMRDRLGPLAFYKKRLSKLYIPMWVCLFVFIAADYFFLGKTYSLTETAYAVLGFFPHADLYHNIDSPLWYFSFIVSYYLLFPLIFWKKFPSLSAALLFGIYYMLVPKFLPGPIDWGVRSLYNYHILAFPLGIVLAHAVSSPRLSSLARGVAGLATRAPGRVWWVLRIVLALILVGVLYYLGVHSWVGKGVWPEQYGSLITVAVLLIMLMVLPFESRLLQWVGQYSYELYLIHWPLLFRYGRMVFDFLPPALATALLLVVCFGFSVILQKMIASFGSRARVLAPINR